MRESKADEDRLGIQMKSCRCILMYEVIYFTIKDVNKILRDKILRVAMAKDQVVKPSR